MQDARLRRSKWPQLRLVVASWAKGGSPGSASAFDKALFESFPVSLTAHPAQKTNSGDELSWRSGDHVAWDEQLLVIAATAKCLHLDELVAAEHSPEPLEGAIFFFQTRSADT